MSNLTHWILRTCGFFGLMALLLANAEKINSFAGFNIPINAKLLICALYLGLLAFYAASIVLYRVFTFNNCQDASLELRKQTEDAKSDLISKGIKLKGF